MNSYFRLGKPSFEMYLLGMKREIIKEEDLIAYIQCAKFIQNKIEDYKSDLGNKIIDWDNN